MATGCLSRSKLPEVPGLDRFQGPTYHTGHWPHEGVDFTGMRVGVIGTGSSARPDPSRSSLRRPRNLTVFQRTPAYSISALDRPLDQSEIDEMKAGYRAWREAQRTSGFGVPVELPTQSALEVSEEERFAKYEAGWQKGTPRVDPRRLTPTPSPTGRRTRPRPSSSAGRSGSG